MLTFALWELTFACTASILALNWIKFAVKLEEIAAVVTNEFAADDKCLTSIDPLDNCLELIAPLASFSVEIALELTTPDRDWET